MSQENIGPCGCCGEPECQCTDYEDVDVLHVEDSLGNVGTLDRMTGPGSPLFGWEGSVADCTFRLICSGAPADFEMTNSAIVCTEGLVEVTVDSCSPLQISFTIPAGECCSPRTGVVSE